MHFHKGKICKKKFVLPPHIIILTSAGDMAASEKMARCNTSTTYVLQLTCVHVPLLFLKGTYHQSFFPQTIRTFYSADIASFVPDQRASGHAYVADQSGVRSTVYISRPRMDARSVPMDGCILIWLMLFNF